MHLDRWKDILGQIKENFSVLEHQTLASEERGGVTTEYIVFEGPLGKMKLEFITKPKVIDKKTTYSNRIGSEVNVDYIYSPSEKVHQFFIYRWEEAEDAWRPVEADNFNL